MCTSDCRCYSGEGQSTKNKWAAYGNDKLKPFKRNSGEKNTINDETGETLYPLKWTNDPSLAVNTF
jgi:hypothetical protein